MSEITHGNPEFAPDTLELEPLHLDDMHDIILESNNAFLAPASDPTQTTEQLLADMANDPKFAPLGYKVNGRIISYIVALSHKDPTTISIGPMYVATDYRGCRLGSTQVGEFIGYAKKNGYEQVYTKTWSGNTGSRSIFASHGFVQQPDFTPEDRVNGDATIGYKLWI